MSAQNCQKCHTPITPEQIQSKQAGTVRGIWLCPACVDALKKQVAMSHSGLLNIPATAAAPAVEQALAGTATMDPPPRTFAADPPPTAPADEGLLATASVDESKGPRVEGGSAIKTLGARGGTAGEYKFRRPLAAPDMGGTRVRTFHARMSGGALQNMDHQINEWLDQHPEIYVKSVAATVGVFEAKISSEEHLVLSIFY